ncbi:MAG: hypothetical protein KGJ62_06400 [Armatimonadetes bacterium]|nr:hypothetical protein [Armatimonadota bacterium]MDE2206545.1 hypothetical protein [Armatimonadota bacterium]
MVPVTLGSHNGSFVDILSGLVAGQSVITSGYRNLKDGDAITTAGASAPPPADLKRNTPMPGMAGMSQ